MPTTADLHNRPLVVCATENSDEDARIAALARAAGIPVNVPDKPELCTFAFGAIVNRGDLSIAIGTDGAAPVLATHLRAWLENELHPRLGHLIALARHYRQRVATHLPFGAARRKFWHTVFTGAPAKAVFAGDEHRARALINDALHGVASKPAAGRIILVGAGPGDPELLTLKAVRAIKSADVILYDRLVGSGVLEHARREVDLIDVGKRRGQHSTSQAAINDLLVEHARAGKVVVRLKGGDAMIFGRAVEELKAAQSAGIDIEVIPGVTAAQAGSAALQLPITSRGDVRQFSLVTGAGLHGTPDLDWSSLAQSGQAFAVYMGIGTSPELKRQLLKAGADRETPVVIVENASLPNQRATSAKLGMLPQAVEESAITGPAIIYVGLDWSDMALEKPAWVETFTTNTVAFPKSRQSIAPPATTPDALPLAV